MEEFVDYQELNKVKKPENLIVTKKDKKILRDLAEIKADIASNTAYEEKIRMWKALNQLEDVRPLTSIYQIPWHEMNVDDELLLKTQTEFSRYLEKRLRKTIYLYKHMPVDYVVEPALPCYKIISNTGFGISEEVDIVKTDEDNDVVSRKFTPQIESEEDIEKIKIPKIIYESNLTESKYQLMEDIFGKILKVEKKGVPGFWFAPWDELIRWWGVENALTDLALRPDMVHKVMNRLMQAYLTMLDQYEDLGLLELNNKNYYIGSGGLGYTDELPGENYNKDNVQTLNLWGSATAQIFSEVSPNMHKEFALDYEIKWMKRFGLNYYGCCEPLDKKIEILKKIPNLRKISMSPWVDLETGARNIAKDYVFSYKPNPALFADSIWESDEIEKTLKRDISILKGCNVEIIMKDISTVNSKPQRLWEWAAIAQKVVQKFE